MAKEKAQPNKAEKEKSRSVDRGSSTKSGKDSKTHPLILGARITEKSAIEADKGIYTFNVAPIANKNEIKKAIKMVYNVSPVKISVTKITSKVVMRGQVAGVKAGGKKAVVHLKKGDKIAFA